MEKTFDREQPDLHDGPLRCPRKHDAGASDRRHAWSGGQPEGRDHPAADQGQLPRGPVGARVLHLHARRPQGSGRHRAAYGRLRLPDASSRRRPRTSCRRAPPAPRSSSARHGVGRVGLGLGRDAHLDALDAAGQEGDGGGARSARRAGHVLAQPLGEGRLGLAPRAQHPAQDHRGDAAPRLQVGQRSPARASPPSRGARRARRRRPCRPTGQISPGRCPAPAR